MKNKIKRAVWVGCFALISPNFVHSQDMVVNGGFAVGASGTISVLSNNFMIGPNAVLTIDGVLNIASENTYLNPSSSISGSGLISFEEPVNYSSGSPLSWTTQKIDGGGINIGSNLQINNPNNLSLVSISPSAYGWVDDGNTDDLYVGADLKFAISDAHLMLNNFNVLLDANATLSSVDASKYVVTNGTGMLKKEALPSNTSFLFPVGRAELDYTPATITNNNSIADAFTVQVKNYSESSSDEADPVNGVYRTWTVFSDLGSAANVALQHNSSTNGSAYTSDADAFVTQYLGINWVPYIGARGTWQLGIGATGTNVTGSTPGSVLNNRSYSSTATSSTASAAFFSKSTNVLQPLPISLLNFNAEPIAFLKSKVSWTVEREINCSKYEVYTSTDGINWTMVGSVGAAGESNNIHNYSMNHNNAKLGVNYYQLKQIDLDGKFTMSNIAEVYFSESSLSSISIYPNPTSDVLNIVSNNALKLELTSIEGKLVYKEDLSDAGMLSVSIRDLADGVYSIQLLGLNGVVLKTEKIVIKK